MDVSENRATPPKSSIWIGSSIIKYPFWSILGYPMVSLFSTNTHMISMTLSLFPRCWCRRIPPCHVQRSARRPWFNGRFYGRIKSPTLNVNCRWDKWEPVHYIHFWREPTSCWFLKMPESDVLLARICFDEPIQINVKMVSYVNFCKFDLTLFSWDWTQILDFLCPKHQLQVE